MVRNIIIIPVKPELDIIGGNDSVVTYRSAHIEGVESRFIVRAEHSSQDHPFVIEELYLNKIGIGFAIKDSLKFTLL